MSVDDVIKPVVLIVEDQAVTRLAAVEMVQEAGFDAVEAEDGAQAMDLLESLQGLRVVLTDIDMPSSIDGIQLAACVHMRWPHVGVVIVSGKVDPRPGDVPSRKARFFAKPYAEAEVMAAIRDFARA